MTCQVVLTNLISSVSGRLLYNCRYSLVSHEDPALSVSGDGAGRIGSLQQL